MQYAFTFRNFSIMYFIGNPMSDLRGFFTIFIPSLDYSIPKIMFGFPNPKPTSRCFPNIFPKSFSWMSPRSIRRHIAIISILILIASKSFGSFIYNPGTGGPTTLTDANGCVWLLGSTIDTSGVVAVTLVSCPSQGRGCTTGMSLGLLLSITCP